LPSQAIELTPYNVEYETKAQGFTLKTIRKIEKKDKLYELSQITSAMLMQTRETSTFSISDIGKFIPHAFIYQRKIFGNNKTREITFYPKKNIAHYYEKKEKSVDVATPNDVYDVLSYQEKIRLILQSAKTTPNHLTFSVIERTRIRDYEFNFTGSEILETSLGYFDTLKIERDRDDSAKKTIVWLAKDWNYVIVKVLHKEEKEPDYILNIVEGSLDKKPIKGIPQPPLAKDSLNTHAQ
jgi:hypothetical protein